MTRFAGLVLVLGIVSGCGENVAPATVPAAPAASVTLYEPTTMRVVGTKDKRAETYTLGSGKTVRRDEITMHDFVKDDVGMSIEEVKNKLDGLRKGNFQTTDERASDCCWLMHEGGVGCTGCACDGRPVWEYCWDYQ